MLCTAPVFFTLLLQNNWSGYLLAIVCLFAAQMVARIMIKAPEHRRALWQIVLLMLAGTLFWVLAQQGGSSISLFIDHFVNRRLLNWDVPTALFQSVNAIAVMAAGVVLAWLMRPEGSVRSVLRVWLKFSFGLLLMGGGFMLLALNARHGAADGQASMGMMVAGLAMMGFAELFIDPVAMAQITRLNMPGVTGVLTGIYMLATGAVANWLAGVVAQQTTESQISDTAIAAYQHFFAQMGEWTLGCVAVMVIIAFARPVASANVVRLPVKLPAAAPDARRARGVNTLSGPRFVAPVSAARPGHYLNSGARSRSLHSLVNRRRIFWHARRPTIKIPLLKP